MKSHFDQIIVGSFVLAVILLGLIALITYRATTGLIHASEKVNHTREVLENLEALLSDLADAEVGQRGYVITGQESFLSPYHAALTDIDRHTKHLRGLISDNPAQQARVARLQPLIQSKLAILKENISLRANSGFEAAQQSISTERGKRIMDEIRQLIADLRAEEENLLQQRDAQAKASARNAFRFAWVGSALSLLLLFLCFHLLRREIAERQRAELEIRTLVQELHNHAAQLESANQELEAFSYSVSHDLRAPLRHISGFVKLLGKPGPEPDPKAGRYLQFIADSARQMGALVDDLLSFSRMSRAEMHFAPVDLKLLAAEIRAELAGSCAHRSLAWHIGDLPGVQGDAAMLRLVLVNLLSNAVKYTGTRTEATIEIICTPNPEEHIISVRDNGVGFDMKYLDKLFGVFQRLHHADEFEGTGIGLANVRRIIHRHGGRTWAEGKPGQGATFYFSLPKRPHPPSATRS